MQETPVLSDDMPPTPVQEAAPLQQLQMQQQQQQMNKKKFGLKRLFGSKKKKESSSQQQQQQQQYMQPPSRSLTPKEEEAAAALPRASSQSSARSRSRHKSPKSYHQHDDNEDISEASSSQNDEEEDVQNDWAVEDLLGDIDATPIQSPFEFEQRMGSSTVSETSSAVAPDVVEQSHSIPETPSSASFKITVKGILSRPFGREHVDKSLQTVCTVLYCTVLLYTRIVWYCGSFYFYREC